MRRGNNEGSIYKRGDGRWCASMTLDGGKRKSVYGKTRADVARRLPELQKHKADGLPAVSERQTVERFLQDWLKSASQGLRPRTAIRYEQFIRVHIVPAIGATSLAKLTPQRLQELYADRRVAGLSPASVRQLHAILHRAFKQGMRWGVLVRNPADAVTPPRVERHEMRALDPEQVMTLVDAARGERLEALIVLAVTGGLRQGELLALRWRDIDLEGAALQIHGTLQPTKGGFVVAPPKTARSRRQVALSMVAVEALRRHRARQIEERLQTGPAWEQPDLVFANEAGAYIDGRNMRHFLDPLVARAGLPRIRFHDLRHSAATLMLSRGVHAKIVSEMLGHSQIAITLDLYSHVTPTMQRTATAEIDAALAR